MLTQYNKIQNLYIDLFIQIKISKVLTGPFIENKIPELLCNYQKMYELAKAACVRHACLRAPCIAWPLLLPSFGLFFFFSLSFFLSVFCF